MGWGKGSGSSGIRTSRKEGITYLKRKLGIINMTTNSSNPSKKLIPPSAKRREIYHDDWIDFNKNGTMDPYENPKLPIEERVEDLLSRMTLEEKVAQLQSGKNIPKYGMGNLTCVLRNIPPKEGAKKANEFQVQAIEETRLGIPVIIHDECLHGCVAVLSTSFPQAIALAATWDPDLMYKVAKATAKETRARGIHQCLSPVVNIVRDVRAGRTEESYGEDPYLTSVMGAAFCRALREEGVIATPKHFVANFVGDGGRDSHEIHFSERILREIYFPGFKACIKAGALSVMAAYNSLDGIPCSCNKWLLTEVLRDEWGFEGFVVSDYASITGILKKHCVAATPEETAKLALEAGLDVELPRVEYYGDALIKAVKEGLVSEEVVNEAVRRVLRAKFLIGLFDNPFADPDEAEKVCGCKEHAELALQAARKAIVLLKNEGNILPLNKEKIKSIAVLGPLSDELKLGGYSGLPPRMIAPLEAIRQKVKPGTKVYHAKGCSIAPGKAIPIPSEYLAPPDAKPGEHGLKGEYFDNPNLSGEPILVRIDEQVNFDWGLGSPDPRIPCDNFSVRWTGKLIPPETGIYELYLITDDGVRLWIDGKLLIDSWYDRGETMDRVRIRLEAGRAYDIRIEYYEHTGSAKAQLAWNYKGKYPDEFEKAVKLAEQADVAVVFVGIIEGEGKDRASLRLPGLQEDLIEKIINTGTPTIVVLMTGSAVVGEWIEKVPAIIQAWYPGQEGGTAIAEVLFGEYNPGGKLPFTWPRHEGQLPLYYNYKPSGRGYDYVDMPGTPLFPFGHGLSYTEFQYSNLKIEADEEKGYVKVSVDVENVGKMKGDEVVQLYIRDVVASIARPLKELKGFKRITLNPGERKTVTFTLTPDDLAFFDLNMRRVVEPGAFEVMIGSSSEDIRLRGKFEVKKKITASFECTELKPEKASGKPGETIKVTAKVKNVGLISDIIPVKLYVNGKEVDCKRIDLSSNEVREISFKLKFPERGEYKVSVGIPELKLTANIQIQ